MIRSNYWVLWLAIMLVAGIASLPLDKLQILGDRLNVPNNTRSILWPSATQCEIDQVNGDGVAYLFPFQNSDYLNGIQAIVALDYDVVSSFLVNAYMDKGNIVALSLLAELDQGTSNGSAFATSIINDWSDSMRAEVAMYYLANAGNCYVAGKYENAVEARDIGLKFLPTGAEEVLGVELNRYIGQIYYKQGRWDDALPWLWRAAGQGKSPLLLITRIMSARGQYEDALPLYWRALEDYPNRPELFLGGATAAVEIGDYKQARQFLDEVQPPQLLGIDGFLLFGKICNNLGDFACAYEKFQNVLEIDENNAEAISAIDGISN